jgi:hypothetical protein
MIARALVAAACVLLATAGAAAAQISAEPLGGLGYWRAGETRPDVPQDVWRGASAALAADVLGRLASDKPLSPAARRTALTLLGAAATAPDGAAEDAGLAAARVRALLALGDPAAASAVLDRTPRVEESAALSEAAAEAALLTGQDEKACRIGQSVRAERDASYWVKLRAYCDAIGGRGPAAQLALTLLEQQGVKDEPFFRLTNAVLAGEGAATGTASLRNGLHAALSRRLALDLAPAVERAAPAAVAVLAAQAGAPEPVRAAAQARAAALGLSERNPPAAAEGDALAAALGEARAALAGGGQVASDVVDGLVRMEAAAAKGAKARLQGAVLLLAAAGAPVPGEHRAAVLRYEAGATEAGIARRLALDLAADENRKGEAALLALDVATGAGAAGPKLADRIEIVRALREVGLSQWRLWAVEGLDALIAPPPPPTRTPKK